LDKFCALAYSDSMLRVKHDCKFISCWEYFIRKAECSWRGVKIHTWEERKHFNFHLHFMTFICFMLWLAPRYLRKPWGSLIIRQRKVFLYKSVLVTGFLTLFRLLWSALNCCLLFFTHYKWYCLDCSYNLVITDFYTCLIWKCNGLFPLFRLWFMIIQRSSGCLEAKCPTNWSRFPPSVTYCVAASVIVRTGLDEFVRIVILVTCLPGIQENPWNSEEGYKITSWSITRTWKFQFSFVIWCVVWMLVPTSLVD
jgi:hypothetical protein